MLLTTLSLFLSLVAPSVSGAAMPPPLETGSGVTAYAAETPDKVQELERKIEALSRDIEQIRLGAAEDPVAERPQQDMGPAASKVYRTLQNRVSIGGYGEMTIQDFDKRKQNGDPSGKIDEADFLRAVLYVGFKYNDWILFNSELEFEHGSTGKGRGEVSVEQAYIDFKTWDALGFRAGLLLVPMGLTNEIHEPTTFPSVRRPSVETNIIPTTWRENGAGLYGQFGPLNYRSYVLTGLQAITNTGVGGFRGSDALRNGRSSGAKSIAEDPAWVTRLDLKPVEGLMAGGSIYVGEADQGLAVHAVPLTLWELHAVALYRGLDLRGLYGEGHLGNVDVVNAANGLTNAAKTSAPHRFFGGYAQAAFNVLSLFPRTRHYLAPFFRYERYDTQRDTPEAMSKDPANSRVEYTLGLSYQPIPQVSIKFDRQWLLNQARAGVGQYNLGISYIF